MALPRQKLRILYLKDKRSTAEISRIIHCSEHKVNYWLAKYNIRKRSISEAIYIKHNPKGDPFSIRVPKTPEGINLLGIGLGLYWGEGTKSNRHSIRLGNSDPRLVKKFIEFLVKIYGIEQKKLRFGLQIFSDMPKQKALRFWQKELGVSISQFQKVIVTPARSIGTYRNKTRHGVLTVQYHNRKLRDIICHMLEDI